MGIMIISAFLAYLLWKAIYKKAPDFITASLVTFIVLFGFSVGLIYPFSYGNNEILYTVELSPINNTKFYLEISDNEYHYQSSRISKKIDGNFEDIRLINSESCVINYCAEYPVMSIISFGIVKTPRHYYEILVPEEAVTYLP